MSEKTLKGRVAIVTGAARNIGRAIATALAKDGADIVVHTLKSVEDAEETAKAVRALGVRAEVICADLTRPEEAERLVAETVKAFGRLDILVNNAAVRRESTILEVSVEEWREVIATSLDAPFFTVRAAAKALSESDRGCVVNIGGMTGHSGAPARPHVVASKAGLFGLTKSLALDFAPYNVTVNCVVPGMVDTKRGITNPGAPVHHKGRKIPLDRLGTPDEIASAVAYLCQPAAHFITGQALHVNGGTYMP